MKMYNKIPYAALSSFLLSLLITGCGSGSGATVQSNAPSTTPSVGNYSGPAPATADVQNFKLAFWDNLVPNNRCGNCHNETQNPRFVRADDINLAFDLANPLVNLTEPDQSALVAKVRGGHNCWLTDDNACGDIITSYIENWAGDSLGGATQAVQLIAPTLVDPGSSKNFPASSGAFASSVYPLLNAYCSNCHSDTSAVPQQPYFASSDVDLAYEAAKTKMDLASPVNSRFVLRLANEFHNCWSNCGLNAAEVETAIASFAGGIAATEVDPDLVTSKALSLVNGIVAASGGRIETNVIALYEFKTGSGSTAFDTSGIEPALNLTLSGDADWVGGWGINMTSGKAQGSTSASAKLYDRLTSTNEYSIEAWVVPSNVTQDGPSRIISYSGGTDDRNFMLGQTLYDYDLLNRTDTTGPDGEPRLSTPSDVEVLQATLQHVVAVYNPADGRSIYVNGELVTTGDPTPTGLLNEWNDTYALALGSEVDNNDRWAGTIRLLAIHSRALTPEQIQTNYDVGVGEKYYLLFNVSDHINITDAYVVFEVSQFDSYSYLFNAPFFAILGSEVPTNIPVRGLRIGVNGREIIAGQAYANMDFQITQAQYTAADGQLPMSNLGTIVALEKGPSLDEFFVTFEQLGNASNVFIEASPPTPPVPDDEPRSPTIGVRDFAELNASLSEITGVPTTNVDVSDTYNKVFQALPIAPSIEGFISSQQMAVTQLAIQYCNVLVDDTTMRSNFFPGFDFTANVSSAFNDTTGVIDPLLERAIGSVGTQPDHGAVRAELDALITRLTQCGGSCESDRTERVVKAACAAVLGSAAVMVQ
jgi:hypothetical protein